MGRALTKAGPYAGLEAEPSYDSADADQVSFLDAGIPGMLLIFADFDGYTQYHSAADQAALLRPDLGAAVSRLVLGLALDAAAP